MGKHIDITGKRFFRLTAVQCVEVRNMRQVWLCKCDCGAENTIKKASLLSGSTKSCGCYMRERSAEEMEKNMTTHDMSSTRFYRIWRNIKYRCSNPKASRWKQYGGRGIQCEWASFEEFRDDMYESYLAHCELYGEENTSINRINNDGNYFKENCEWEIATGQARNRKTSRFLEFHGETKTIAEWSEIRGIEPRTLQRRVGKLGWSIEKALTLPVRAINNQKVHNH